MTTKKVEHQFFEDLHFCHFSRGSRGPPSSLPDKKDLRNPETHLGRFTADRVLTIGKLGRLGPGGWDSDWIPYKIERDCYLGALLKSQTANPNHQFCIS